GSPCGALVLCSRVGTMNSVLPHWRAPTGKHYGKPSWIPLTLRTGFGRVRRWTRSETSVTLAASAKVQILVELQQLAIDRFHLFTDLSTLSTSGSEPSSTNRLRAQAGCRGATPPSAPSGLLVLSACVTR